MIVTLPGYKKKCEQIFIAQAVREDFSKKKKDRGHLWSLFSPRTKSKLFNDSYYSSH